MEIKLKPNKHDFIIGSVLLLIIVSLIISLTSLKDSSDHYVYIKYDKQLVHQMDLYEDEVFVLYQSDYENLYGDIEITVKRNLRRYLRWRKCSHQHYRRKENIS